MVISSVITLFGIGIAASAILGIASKVFYVEEDPRVEAIMDVLPGANCGGCGYAGCEGFAIAVINDPSVAANLCVAGSDQVTAAVGELSGKAVVASDPKTSYRHCVKMDGTPKYRFEYQGISSCVAANNLDQGEDACVYSCLGLGDCKKACPFDAIVMRDGLAVVLIDLCVACGKCITACPRQVLEIIPQKARVAVACSTKNKAKAATETCSVGCMNCNACVRKCPAKAISSVDGRIHLDQDACLAYGPECDEICMDSCPRNIIRAICPETAKRKAEQKAAAAAAKKAKQNAA